MIVEVVFEFLYKAHLIEQVLSQESYTCDRLLVRTCNYSIVINYYLYVCVYLMIILYFLDHINIVSRYVYMFIVLQL